MKRIVSTYLIGLIFGIGIMMSGMANPAKVLNFFDFFGTWDPSLIFVMGGAILVAAPGYWLVVARPAGKPLMDAKFHVPQNRKLDAKLIAGSAVFGVGWGIAGFCPGGALPAIGTLNPAVLTFTAALIAGIFAAKFAQTLTARRTNSATA
ncbi:YeeE/YedE family protein [Salibaculum griseiflavum]|uniref:Permease n=1 Tax=Salibaculum griseiflavum TaxID=1914409 RepID=A0A2V1P2M6_9RHOB|nr:YeeE/YedE family protein [Salibaculum griseiflavum]PWG16030.1 permease [Salibaculum griseiflavum]